MTENIKNIETIIVRYQSVIDLIHKIENKDKRNKLLKAIRYKLKDDIFKTFDEKIKQEEIKQEKINQFENIYEFLYSLYKK